MNKKDTTYRMPEGFNPYASLDSVRGLSDAIHHFMLEGPGTQRVIPSGERAGVNALIELVQSEARALHEYFAELENQSLLDLPRDQEELDEMKSATKNEVKEPAAIYAIK